jgi:GNAT superfamily N-acetyltransferase
MNYTIRDCAESDLQDLIGLCARHAAYEKAEYHVEDKAERLRLAIFHNPKRLYCHLVMVEQKAIGFFSYTFDYSTWDAAEFLYLDCLYLDEEYRGMGVGTKVFELLKEIAANKKCVNIQWQTPDFNESAIRFYRRIGGVDKSKQRFTLNIKD